MVEFRLENYAEANNTKIGSNVADLYMFLNYWKYKIVLMNCVFQTSVGISNPVSSVP